MKNSELLKLLDNIKQEENVPTFNKHSRVLFIDGLNLFLRNFAMINYINQTGVHIGGLAGFLRSLGSLIKLNQPTSVYVIFDGIGSSINRKNLLPEYKSNRNITRITNWDVFEDLEEENDAKVDQIARLIHYLRCLPVSIISMDKSEADDIIAYLANYFTQQYDSQSIIVSSDKDFIQLVNKNITVYRPTEKDFYTPDTVKEKFNILSTNFILYKTLMGDNSDKVQGVKGLGDKKILKLFPELSERTLSLDDIFDISEQKYKDHIIYSRIVFEKDNLKRNYKIMNLQNPLVDDSQIRMLNQIVKQPTNSLDIPSFIHLYNEDGLVNVLKNANYWLQENFKVLNSFKK
jgi:5'-3' exonuclease